MTLGGIQSAAASLIKAVSGVETIWAYPSQNRPALPFLVLSLEQVRPIGQVEYRTADNPSGIEGDPEADPPTIGTELLVQSCKRMELLYKLLYCSASAYSHSATCWLTELVQLLENQNWGALNSSFLATSSVQALPKITSVGFEGGASCDFTLTTMLVTESTETYLETVAPLNGTIDGEEL